MENKLTEALDKTLVEAYSQGKITRHEIQNQTNQIIGFGFLLGQLHYYNLPLPRFPVDRQSLGVQLVKQLTQKAMQEEKIKQGKA
jgi:hypothetical protein